LNSVACWSWSSTATSNRQPVRPLPIRAHTIGAHVALAASGKT
jgi:hypothetical protein